MRVYTNSTRYEVEILVLTINVHVVKKVKKCSTGSTWWRYYKVNDQRNLK
jgi:hypothetical protein